MEALKTIHGNYSDQLFKRMFRNVKDYTVELMQQNMFYQACELMRVAYESKEFISVTGNLINSIAVGIYYKGKLIQTVTADTMNVAPAKRFTLKAGEKYPISKWYDHTEPYSGLGEKEPVYIAPTGEKHVSGRTAAIKKLHEIHPWKRDTWALIMVAPLEYTEYVQTVSGHNVLTAARDELPRIAKTMYI